MKFVCSLCFEGSALGDLRPVEVRVAPRHELRGGALEPGALVDLHLARLLALLPALAPVHDIANGVVPEHRLASLAFQQLCNGA